MRKEKKFSPDVEALFQKVVNEDMINEIKERHVREYKIGQPRPKRKRKKTTCTTNVRVSIIPSSIMPIICNTDEDRKQLKEQYSMEDCFCKCGCFKQPDENTCSRCRQTLREVIDKL